MKKILLAGFGIAALCTVLITLWVVLVLSHLPNVSSLKHYRPAAAAEILDKDGTILTEFFDRKFRIWVPITTLPPIVIKSVVTAEDDTFFEHKGINYKATWDALVHDLHKRRFARGGSTITQQMIKNVFLSREKTLTRKFREYILAREAEEILTKRQILQIYLNEVEWGDNIYGIEAASRFYFDKHASELSVGESALLAGMLPNPHYYNPYKRPDKAKDRQVRVLGNMLQAKLITSDEYDTALHTPWELRKESSGKFSFSALTETGSRPCYQLALEQVLLNLFGEQDVYRKGWTIKTSIDKGLQADMTSLEDASQAGTREAPDRVTVVTQGGAIRAIVCSASKDSQIREKLPSTWFSAGYDVSSVSLDSIKRSEIVESAPEEH